jgi:hypothetical protein
MLATESNKRSYVSKKLTCEGNHTYSVLALYRTMSNAFCHVKEESILSGAHEYPILQSNVVTVTS